MNDTTLLSTPTKNKKFGNKIEFQPYHMDDVREASSKELFTVVSTFAGGGGSSTGYRLAGGKVLLINEFVPEAIKTYSVNFPDTPIDHRDIREITKYGDEGILKWLNSYGIEKGQYDILDGSPPCSSFSQIGKGPDHAGDQDVRYSDVVQSDIGYLIYEWVKVAKASKPKIAILENVPEMRHSDIFKDALTELGSDYITAHKVLRSSWFGVPQQRERLFVIGIRKDIAEKQGLLKEQDVLDLFPKGSSYEPTLYDAIHDLKIDEEERDLCMTSARKGASYEVLKLIKNDPEKVYRANFDKLDLKNIYFSTNRLAWYKPAHTNTQLGAQLNSMGGLYHPNEDRQLTIDELKRIQGLPDDFRLTGTFNQRAERIGRMVPPLLLKYVSSSLYQNVLRKI